MSAEAAQSLEVAELETERLPLSEVTPHPSSPIIRTAKKFDRETQLALRAGKGDSAAMEEFLLAITNPVWSEIHDHCRSLRREDKEDIHQLILYAVCRGLPRFQGRSSVKTWVHVVTHSQIADYHRRWFRRQKRVKWVSLPDDLDTLEHCADAPRLDFEIWEILKHIPAAYRSVLELHYKDGYNPQEIADIEHLTYEATRSRLRRATKYISDRKWLWQAERKAKLPKVI